MRRNLLSFVLCFFLASALNAEVIKNNSGSVTNLNIIKNGKTIPLNKFKGSILVFYFFNDDMDSWIKPINILNQLSKQFADKNVKIGAFTSKSKEQISKQMKKIDFISFVKNIDFPIITESKSAVLLNIKTPCAYVSGLNGKIRWKGQLKRNLNKIIAELINEKSLNITETDDDVSTINWISELNGIFVKFDTSVPPPPPGELMNGIPVPRIDRDINAINSRRKMEKSEKPIILDTKQRKSSFPPAKNNSLYKK